MQKIVRYFLITNRKHRFRVINVILWTLRLLRDIEEDEFWQTSERMDDVDPWDDDASRREYAALEEKYTACENALGFLEPAIEDLEFVEFLY